MLLMREAFAGPWLRRTYYYGGSFMRHPISKDVVNALAAEIGPDAAYYRQEKDRLYLSGIEIATIIGTGVLISFCLGLFEGIKKGLSKQGEKLGEKLVNLSVEKLKGLLSEVDQVDTQKPEAIPNRLQEIHSQLDEAVDVPELIGAAGDEDPALHALEVHQIEYYLKRIGFPRDDASRRAEVLVVRIRREISLL